MQRIQKIFSLLESSPTGHSQKRDIEKILSLKLKNKLIFFCSDSFDIDNSTLKILAKQNDVIFLHISDIFEDTLKGEGLKTLKNLTQSFSISLRDEGKIHAYQKLRESKKHDFRQTLRSLGIETVSFITESHIYALILELMKRRESRR